MSLNLSQLRAFVAVLDHGGFGAAADELGVSQSAISHSVAALERTLGGAVLTRHGHPRPTAFGDSILGHARAALAAAVAIADLAAQRDGLPAGAVRLAAPTTVCQGLLPRLIPQWKTELPRVDVAVFEGEDDEVADWLARSTVDLAILVDPPPGPGTALAEDAFHVLLREDHPLAGEPGIGPADLEDDAFLLSCGGCERHLRELYRRAGTPLSPTHRIRDVGTLLAMVRAGIGVTIVPGLTAAMLVPGLVMVPVRPSISRRLVLTGPVDRPWHPAVTALVGAAGRGADTPSPHPE
ncbi:LysR family transcriptional regulator [Actinoallomurus liliacearum]|uniref:LysR family transcriptional regulator n=1 Tax=Actinoallomurus liliacearum TaxID=1080073 RepID=A0ABP8TD16_9ACTN